MPELEEALKFIKKFEAENHGKSAYEIANKLRGYTKKGYTTKLWSTATGYKQDYIEGKYQGILNKENVVLSGKSTDFGHFIAALSDQINQPGINWSKLTSWTADHTSWAGDIGSAIILYYSKTDNGRVHSLEEILNRYASDADYTADIVAYLVGALINSGHQSSVSEAISQYNTKSYPENVKTFIKSRFRGIIEGNTLRNPAEVEAEVRRSISTFIRLYPTVDIFKSVKNLLKLQPKLERENTLLPSGLDLLQGSAHFLTHLIREGSLDSLTFKPYQMPGMPWLGTVDYKVNISR
ncbi:MAG TPA: hypothetical protein V6D11_09290 [Waterburya sp.]|jgi:hypothetical protein